MKLVKLIPVMLIGVTVTATISHSSRAQSASISESKQVIPTYPFSGANNIPILAKDERLYPYHSFDEYSFDQIDQEWTVITLENEYVKVFVLPEVGGKVWGAIEKSTGNEFIYKNEVLKFRNIALRGPWTSGGIEFNFGVIGHTPSTATPVEYKLVENDDGSVSCFVGTMDLPSRTEWRVEIRLPADAAYFETNASWSNPTPTNQPYYNWMTGAAVATDDLELVVPGNQYLKHNGESLPWPTDTMGRDLRFYPNNQFGGNKSYHVVGEFNDFFGGYFHDSDVGFGHLTPHASLPGQKIWLWALSRQGGIWEDLLTDTDGQYTEFQAGRLFVQYAPGDHINPIRQATFEPYRSDRWSEIWFPVKGLGGFVDVSKKGVMNVELDRNELTISINPFVATRASVPVVQNEKILHQQEIAGNPMDVISFRTEIDPTISYEVIVDDMDLHYYSDPEVLRLSRPFATDPEAISSQPAITTQIAQAKELMDARYFSKAQVLLDAALEKQPWNRDALLARAEMHFKASEYDSAKELVDRALQLDSNDPDANYLFGIISRATGNLVDAKEAFGWAERSMKYRANANTQLAEIAILEGDFDAAMALANHALIYDQLNINAHKALVISTSRTGDQARSRKHIASIDRLDPLNIFGPVETVLAGRTPLNDQRIDNSLRSEFANQSLIETAIYYSSIGLNNEAFDLMSLAVEAFDDPIAAVWLAYLIREANASQAMDLLQSASQSEKEARPYRRETIPVLEWAAVTSNSWYFDYLLGLNYWAKSRHSDALTVFDSIGNSSSAYFYAARSALREQLLGSASENDLVYSTILEDNDWRLWLELINFYYDNDDQVKALEVSTEAVLKFGDNFNIALAHARSLLHSNRADEAVELFETLRVLPSEHARESRTLYEWAHIAHAIDEIAIGDHESAIQYLALSLEWPERIGQGRPYNPDERLQNFLLGLSHMKSGNQAESKTHFDSLVAFEAEQLDEVGILVYRILKETDPTAASGFLEQLTSAVHNEKAAWIMSAILSDQEALDRLDSENEDRSLRYERQLILRAFRQ